MRTLLWGNNLLLIVLLFIFGGFVESKQPISKKQNVNLTVKVVGYKNTNGKTQIGLYNNEISFPKINKQYKTAIINVNSFVTKYTFSIPVGYYAVALFHDANADGVCNTNFLGIPKEGYGFSNNIKPIISAPTFNETKMSIQKDMEIEIRLIY